MKEEKAKLAHMVAMREAKLAQQEAELESQVWLLTQSYSVRFYTILCNATPPRLGEYCCAYVVVGAVDS